ncbi:hypothetical protein BTH50_07750 [Lactobacillus delbrueckii subsp. bulgaricus]|nr:hypothetical protein [Lactobacillus delbrueckii subsp. bulgaricus]MBT8851403.1 hypothetical protein [Lactobacillus delbrueckii subsp. bulgaricus]
MWFIDSDDVVLNGVLSKIGNIIVDNDFDIFVFGYVKKENFEGVKGPKNIKVQKLNKEDAIYSLLDPSFATFPWNKIFRRELIVKNNISFPVEMVLPICSKARQRMPEKGEQPFLATMLMTLNVSEWLNLIKVVKLFRLMRNLQIQKAIML